MPQGSNKSSKLVTQVHRSQADRMTLDMAIGQASIDA